MSVSLELSPKRKWPMVVFGVLSVLVALVSFRLLFFAEQTIGPTLVHHLADRPGVFFTHVVFAAIALLLLPIQFSAKLRRTRLGLHRWTGRLYGLSIALGGMSGLVLALTTSTGSVAASGFFLLSLVWMFTTALAIMAAIRKDIPRHRRWMIRSAALTFAAVTLRLYLPIGEMTVGMDVAYPAIAWLCWVPNLIFAQLRIARL